MCYRPPAFANVVELQECPELPDPPNGQVHLTGRHFQVLSQRSCRVSHSSRSCLSKWRRNECSHFRTLPESNFEKHLQSCFIEYWGSHCAPALNSNMNIKLHHHHHHHNQCHPHHHHRHNSSNHKQHAPPSSLIR